jgi:hypothetical protein
MTRCLFSPDASCSTLTCFFTPLRMPITSRTLMSAWRSAVQISLRHASSTASSIKAELDMDASASEMRCPNSASTMARVC